jgi:hypothetical protein
LGKKKPEKWGFPAEVKLVRLGCVVGKEKIKLVLIKQFKSTQKVYSIIGQHFTDL